MTHEDGCVYVLGTGASLLGLTEEEKEYLRYQTTVGMNKYLLFWHILDVYPKYAFMADDHYPAPRVVQESVLLSQQLGRPVHWLLNSMYEEIFGLSPERILAIRDVVTTFREDYCFDYRPDLVIHPVTYFTKVPGNRYDGWATNLSERMCALGGSLTTLMNVLCVLDLGRTIKLLGVDLSTAKGFHDEEFLERRELHDVYTRLSLSQPEPCHFTLRGWTRTHPLAADLVHVFSHALASGYRVVCGNPESLLVQQGICEYSPVLPE